MKVMVSLEERFIRDFAGQVYSQSAFGYKFWQRYLQVFDEVLVFARMTDEPKQISSAKRSDGPAVKFISLPCFIGPWQFLQQYPRLKSIAKKAVNLADAFILRVPGTVSNLLWHQLLKKNIPYAVEVVGDPQDSLASGSVKSVVRPFVRKRFAKEMTQQCKMAAACSYVTEYSLQKRYPPGSWSTHYSSIELAPEIVVDDPVINKRIERINRKYGPNEPWRICYAGTMAQLYKAPDILIDAVAQCVADGLNLELVMLGDGKYRGQLEQQVQSLGIGDKVKFLGALPAGKAVYEQFDKADLYVLPSRQEGLPRSIIEAMARGLPCIGSTVGGFPELLAAEDLVPPGDVKALVDKLEAVLADANRMEKMLSRNLIVAKKYSLNELNRRRVEFYKKIVEQTNKYSSRKR